MHDTIGTIEALYAAERDERRWLDSVLATLEGLSEGRRAYALAFAPAPGGGRMEITAMRGIAIDLKSESQPINQLLDPPTFRLLYNPHPTVDLLSRRARQLPPEVAAPFAETFRRMGMPEVLGVFGGDPGSGGLLLGLVRARPGDGPPARTQHLLRMVSAHLTSARRLRAAWGSEPTTAESPGVDAVLGTTGRVEHATGDARDDAARAALSDAVQRVEWARGKARRAAPEEAARAWRGLVDGTWTLVDRVERDGRRIVLARRNPPGMVAPVTLTPEERAAAAYASLGHSNKYIAYLLGVAPSTVDSRLARARAKLGVRSRLALMAFFASEAAAQAPVDASQHGAQHA